MELTQEQKDWLDKCTKPEGWMFIETDAKGVGVWKFNWETGLIDVYGDFDCSNQNLKDFKGVRFGVISQNFDCRDNELTSLEGAPQEVGWTFNCENNNLTSLEGAPQVVKGHFDCDNNQLTSLVGAPQEVGAYFDCRNNKLTSLVGAPQSCCDFNCENNQLTSLEGAPQDVYNFRCYDNPISKEALKLIHKTMCENEVPYIIALGMVKNKIDDLELVKLNTGLSDDALKGASMLGRFMKG